MVRRKKQVKPRGAAGDKPEAALTLASRLNERSPLVALPAEIQGIITSHLVQYRDLNHLCCTCKTLSAVVLPILYHTLELKVPLQWRRLSSLENLLASSSEGFKYTRCLRIVTKQHGLESKSYSNLDKLPETEDEHESGDEEEVVEEAESDDSDDEEESDEHQRAFRVYTPHPSASNALNAFIRVLLVKFPSQQLHTFWWEHACALQSLTLSIVLERHGASINTLNLEECSGNWKTSDLVKFTIEGLTTLGIGDLNGISATKLLLRNYQNLRHLRLGSEVDLAIEYARKGYLDPGELQRVNATKAFAKLAKSEVAALNEPSPPFLRLESLSLIGLNFLAFVGALIEPDIDFNSLSMLTLESCACLEAALPFLTRAVTGKPKAKSSLRLHTLAIRHENASSRCLRKLETFLLLLKPLANLHILLEGLYDEGIDMRKLLRVHGKSLQSLIWDERMGPRSDVQDDTSLLPDDHKDLTLIAKYCPGLKALGIGFDWQDIFESDKNHKKIASSFSRLSQLQTLNIRNLPEATASQTSLPHDYMVEGLAAMILKIVIKRARIEEVPALTTLAIGASTYGNARVGMSHYTPNHASTFLQLRIYHINYDCQYRNSLSPKLHLIARGTPADARGDAENLDIFTPYWLDGAAVEH